MTPDNIASLQSLIQSNPALTEQLQSATTSESAAEILAHAAREKGIAVDAGAIAEHLEAAKAGSMSDSELEAVAGGLLSNSNFIVVSVFTFLLGCAIYSANNPKHSFETCIKK